MYDQGYRYHNILNTIDATLVISCHNVDMLELKPIFFNIAFQFISLETNHIAMPSYENKGRN